MIAPVIAARDFCVILFSGTHQVARRRGQPSRGRNFSPGPPFSAYYISFWGASERSTHCHSPPARSPQPSGRRPASSMLEAPRSIDPTVHHAGPTSVLTMPAPSDDPGPLGVGPLTHAGPEKEVKARSESKKSPKGRGATRGLPRRSPILVLLSPKHA